MAYLRTPGREVDDPAGAQLAELVAGSLDQAVTAVLGFLDPGLGDDRELTRLVAGLSRDALGQPGSD